MRAYDLIGFHFHSSEKSMKAYMTMVSKRFYRHVCMRAYDFAFVFILLKNP